MVKPRCLQRRQKGALSELKWGHSCQLFKRVKAEWLLTNVQASIHVLYMIFLSGTGISSGTFMLVQQQMA